MCRECGFYTCPSNCPNAGEPEVFAKCDICGAEIYEGDEYYELEDRNYCEACVLGGYKTAEID